MPEDHEIYQHLIQKSQNRDSQAKESILLPNDNSEKAKILKEILAEIEYENQYIERQDVIQYKIKFTFVTQAMSIILISLMIINSLIFLLTSTPLGVNYIVSMAMFIQSGILFILAGIMIPRKTLVKPRNYRQRNWHANKSDFIFAFTHSLTYFLTAFCMVILSVMFYKL